MRLSGTPTYQSFPHQSLLLDWGRRPTSLFPRSKVYSYKASTKRQSFSLTRGHCPSGNLSVDRLSLFFELNYWHQSLALFIDRGRQPTSLFPRSKVYTTTTRLYFHRKTKLHSCWHQSLTSLLDRGGQSTSLFPRLKVYLRKASLLQKDEGYNLTDSDTNSHPGTKASIPQKDKCLNHTDTKLNPDTKTSVPQKDKCLNFTDTKLTFRHQSFTSTERQRLQPYRHQAHIQTPKLRFYRLPCPWHDDDLYVTITPPPPPNLLNEVSTNALRAGFFLSPQGSFILCTSLFFSAVFLGSQLQSVAPCQISSFSVVQKWPYSFHAVCIQVQISRKPNQNITMISDGNNFIIKHKNQEREMLQYAPSLAHAHKIAINR